MKEGDAGWARGKLGVLGTGANAARAGDPGGRLKRLRRPDSGRHEPLSRERTILRGIEAIRYGLSVEQLKDECRGISCVAELFWVATLFVHPKMSSV